MMHIDIGQQPGSSIYQARDGFSYLSYRSTENGKHYLRCTSWRQGCPGRAIFNESDNDFQMTSGHSHEADFSREILAQRNAIVDQARSQTLPFNNLIGLPLDRNLNRAVSRASFQTLPTLENLASLSEVLENPLFAWLTATSDRLDDAGYKGSVQAPNGSQVLLFLNKKSEDFLKSVTSIAIINTSTVLNNQQHPVITVASMWNRNVISLAWLLLENGSAETFSAGFSLLKTYLPIHQIRQCMSHRNEVIAAFHGVFPTVKIHPTLFDYIHELKTNTELLDCVTNLLQSPAGVKILKLCCAVSLLPKDMMQVGLSQIISTAQWGGEEISTWSQQLFNFIDREWLSAPNFEFNLCGNFERSHFGIEALKLKLERILASCDNFYSVTKYITNSLSKSQEKINAVVRGTSLRSSVPKPITAEHQYWNLLDATGFPLEMKVNNILSYISEKLII